MNTLVPPGGSPETYQPPPSVMMDLGKSERYFQVGGLGFEEAWSRRLKEINPDVTVVNCSERIDLMEGDGHHHDEMEGHGHHHGDKEEHSSHHEGLDPHVWTSPRTMKPFTRHMVEEVIAIDPRNEAQYRANYEQLMQLIERVDSTVQSLLKDLPSRSFIIYHPRWAISPEITISISLASSSRGSTHPLRSSRSWWISPGGRRSTPFLYRRDLTGRTPK